MSANYAYPMSTADVSEPRTQIASELDALETEINYTEKIAAEFSERIHTAVCPRTDENAKGQSVPEPVRSPLGAAIHGQKVRLERINEQMRRLMASIDLPLIAELSAPKASHVQTSSQPS